jgi:DNA-binding NarL/FixJ family response regulator
MPEPEAPQRQPVSETIGLIAAEERIAETLRAEGFAVVHFAEVETALSTIATERVDAVVLRILDAPASLPRAIEPLSEQLTIPVLIVCGQIERWEVRAALAAGAGGVVLESELASALPPSLRAAIAGQICVPRAHWRQVEPPVLSAREKQVLGLVVMGYMNGQIAEQLFLAESTVKSHLSSAFGKLGVRSRNEAVNLILDPERGLGMGILALGGERLDTTIATAG